MRRLRGYLSVIGGIAMLFAIAEALSTWLGTRLVETLLGVMVGASALLSLLLARQKSKLRRQLMQMPEIERRKLAAVSDEVKYALPKAGAGRVDMTVLAGKVLVNWPTVPLMVAPIVIMQAWFSPQPPLPQFLALGGGFALAWLWWSVGASLWRRWAKARGMSAAEIQHYGEAAWILAARGSFIERTEWRRKKE